MYGGTALGAAVGGGDGEGATGGGTQRTHRPAHTGAVVAGS